MTTLSHSPKYELSDVEALVADALRKRLPKDPDRREYLGRLVAPAFAEIKQLGGTIRTDQMDTVVRTVREKHNYLINMPERDETMRTHASLTEHLLQVLADARKGMADLTPIAPPQGRIHQPIYIAQPAEEERPAGSNRVVWYDDAGKRHETFEREDGTIPGVREERRAGGFAKNSREAVAGSKVHGDIPLKPEHYLTRAQVSEAIGISPLTEFSRTLWHTLSEKAAERSPEKGSATFALNDTACTMQYGRNHAHVGWYLAPESVDAVRAYSQSLVPAEAKRAEAAPEAPVTEAPIEIAVTETALAAPEPTVETASIERRGLSEQQRVAATRTFTRSWLVLDEIVDTFSTVGKDRNFFDPSGCQPALGRSPEALSTAISGILRRLPVDAPMHEAKILASRLQKAHAELHSAMER